MQVKCCRCKNIGLLHRRAGAGPGQSCGKRKAHQNVYSGLKQSEHYAAPQDISICYNIFMQ
jgi:hypothetical protein